MKKEDLSKLTDEELLVEKKKLKQSKVFHAISIGFLAGILLFGVISWSLSSEKKLGFLIPMLIPIVFIYNLLRSPNKNKNLEEVLSERDLN
jgi:ATP/ADP translocase